MKPPGLLLLSLALTLTAAVDALPLAAAADGTASCTPPYESQPGYTYALRVAPGEARAFSTGLTIAAGERALIEGTARVSGGITVQGTLYLSSTASSTLSADWVVVEAGGALIAGSKGCPLPPGVTATLELRDGSVHPKAGRKALAVLAGGTLEVRGRVGGAARASACALC